jgi:hypothetical protein
LFHADGEREATELIVAFRNFAKDPTPTPNWNWIESTE